VRPIRLGCCITELNPGGAEKIFVDLVCRLDRNRWNPTVISLGSETEPLVEPLRTAGVEVRCLSVKRRWDVTVVRRLATELRALRVDALQTWLFHANVAGSLAAARVGIDPVMTGIRVAEHRGRWRLGLERLCTRRARRHICVSDDVAKFSRDRMGLNAKKIVVIPNGVDVTRFADADPLDLSGHGISEQSPVVAWIGRLDRQKDPVAAIEALGRLEAKLSHCQLVLAGEGPLRGQVEARIAELRLGDRVHLLGRITEIPSLLARSCGLMLTSRWEGMPNVVLEAMAAGRPVVARGVEGVNALVEDGSSGWVVAGERVASLSDALGELLCDVPRAEVMGLRGQQKVLEEFSIQEMVSRYETLWEREISLVQS